jgi:hypothetical protein
MNRLCGIERSDKNGNDNNFVLDHSESKRRDNRAFESELKVNESAICRRQIARHQARAASDALHPRYQAQYRR